VIEQTTPLRIDTIALGALRAGTPRRKRRSNFSTRSIAADTARAASPPTVFDLTRVAALAAAAGPSLLAWNLPPSPTFLNQALAVALWGTFIASTRADAAVWRARPPRALGIALALVGAAAVGSWAFGTLPAGLALSALGMIASTALLTWSGASAAYAQRPEERFALFATAWVVAGVANVAIALVQVFWSSAPDGDWIAASSLPGRAVGNLRQPNHLSSLLLWSCIATVALLELRRLSLRWAAMLGALFVFGVVLTASRTGLVSVLLLAAWGLLDARAGRRTRALLLTAPLMYALAWLAMAGWAQWTSHSFGGEQRLAAGDISSSRFAIWSNTLELVRMHPWTGVGMGEFNFAWTLTGFTHRRPTAFFDHTHNLPLQFAVELGLPLAVLLTGLLLWALWRGFRGAWAADGPVGSAQRAAMMFVLMIGLHSLLEYPLWYSYFLLPAAWAWGFALADASERRERAGGASTRWLAAGGVAMVLGAAISVVDYLRVAGIFSAREGAPPLEQRIKTGQRSWFFAHHADYALVTTFKEPDRVLEDFRRPAHFLLDARLMQAWAEALAAAGDVDRGRWVAQRLAEFHRPQSQAFFAPCADPAKAGESRPFQCEAPLKRYSFEDFR
jgi:O-antigen ligase